MYLLNQFRFVKLHGKIKIMIMKNVDRFLFSQKYYTIQQLFLLYIYSLYDDLEI